MSFQTASAILRGKWLLDHGWTRDHLPVISGLLKGTSAFEIDRKSYKDGDETEDPRKNPSKVASAVASNVYRVSLYTDYSRIPQNSTALIDINGPILKYGDMCSYGSVDYVNMIKTADASPNVSAIILSIDSPGGQVDGTQTLVEAIKAASKPVIAIVNDGMMASAAMWVGSAADELYASMPTDLIGSIGVYATLYDWKSYFEKEGLKVHDIYAPQSTEKNIDYKEAMNGDYAKVEEELRVIADRFIQSVAENRGAKAAENKDKWSTGKIMFAQEAEAMGLIDGIKSLDEVITRVSEIKSKNSQNNNTMFGNKFSKLSALKGKAAADVTAEELTAANEQIHAEGITDFTLVADAALQANADRINELETALQASNEAKDSAVAAQKVAEDALAALKAAPGASASGGKAEADKGGDGEEELLPEEKEARAAYARAKS